MIMVIMKDSSPRLRLSGWVMILIVNLMIFHDVDIDNIQVDFFTIDVKMEFHLNFEFSMLACQYFK